MSAQTSRKTGPKPIYGTPMTAAERKRRSRQKLAEDGGKEYLVKIEGIHMKAIAAMAKGSGEAPNEVLRFVLRNALDRLVGVLNRAARLEKRGATADEVEAFMQAHLYPALPSIDELERE